MLERMRLCLKLRAFLRKMKSEVAGNDANELYPQIREMQALERNLFQEFAEQEQKDAIEDGNA